MANPQAIFAWGFFLGEQGLMRAAILHQPGKLIIDQAPDPGCPETGVLVQVKTCGICASDARMVAAGHPALVYPRIPGHEIVGIVAQSRDKALKEGDRVHVAPGLRCGRCRDCRQGQDQRCLSRQIFGFSRDGGFAQKLAVPTQGPLKGAVCVLDPGARNDVASLIEPLACCINAQDRLGIGADDNVVIVGAGMLGLLHLMLARRRGAAGITVIEPLDRRRQTALALGADRVADPADTDQLAAAFTASDALILAAGPVVPEAALLASMNRGARIAFFSGSGPGPAGHLLDPAWLHYNEITVTGSYGCGAVHNQRAADLVSEMAERIAPLITCRVDLEHIDAGLIHTSARTGFKAIVEISDE
jgi:L-iditol 2-dehydrogenase